MIIVGSRENGVDELKTILINNSRKLSDNF